MQDGQVNTRTTVARHGATGVGNGLTAAVRKPDERQLMPRH